MGMGAAVAPPPPSGGGAARALQVAGFRTVFGFRAEGMLNQVL